jgi:hypothetical protein
MHRSVIVGFNASISKARDNLRVGFKGILSLGSVPDAGGCQSAGVPIHLPPVVGL